MIVKLTNAFAPRPEWVNLDRVLTIRRMPAVDNDHQGRAPERTELWFGGRGDDREALDVAETPEQIVAIASPETACPETACPDPPGECGYYGHYLAYGGPDLTHAGYHAAVEIHERHARDCRVYESGRLCPLCTSGEQRLRA